ncbi:MAG: tRNA (adenosine(37)-N6)-threonylcarbamoyltransferase complex dimerization subunit type 1 TsaB [Stappiaceae bacterium]
MNILAIDTSLERCSVALRNSGSEHRDIVITETIGIGHAELLPSMVSEVLSTSALKAVDVDRIGVVCGPGSFAGLRVGLSMARGMALVNKADVVGIPTLSALATAAAKAASDLPIVVIQDARRKELFVQIFDAAGLELGPPQVTTLPALGSVLPRAAILIGSGAKLVKETLDSSQDMDVICDVGAPDIEAVLKLTECADHPFCPPSPIYLRGPDAKKQSGFAVARA